MSPNWLEGPGNQFACVCWRRAKSLPWMASEWWSDFDVCLAFFYGEQPYYFNGKLLNRRKLNGELRKKNIV